MWKLRRSFWCWIQVLKFRSAKPVHIPLPVDAAREVRSIPVSQRYPDIPIHNILVGDHVPSDERKARSLRFCEFNAWLLRVFPSMQAGVGAIDRDPTTAFDQAYSGRQRKCFPGPVVPPEYEGDLDLGYLAVAGPYFCYLERAPEGGFQWDLRGLDAYEHHEGLRRLGVRVHFEVEGDSRRLVATEIESELGRSKPGDETWPLAKKLALTAVTTQLSLVQHFNWVHLTVVAQVATATRNDLPTNHPVRRLLWPHAFGTHNSNELVTKILLQKDGDLANVFSLTHEGLWRLFTDSYKEYDIRVIDAAADAERRGVTSDDLDLPALDNRVAHLDVMQAHALRYLSLYYPSDDDLRNDAAVVAWIATLNELVPNGVTGLLGQELTVEGAARLIGAFIYVGSVEHDLLGTGLWNYQLWSHVQPVRLYQNGQRVPRDVYQRLVNYNFVLNISRAPLVQDFSYMALDDKGRAAFKQFHRELQELQARLDEEEFAHWKVYPNKLEASING